MKEIRNITDTSRQFYSAADTEFKKKKKTQREKCHLHSDCC